MKLKGIIFDIKQFAVHDGPGIRTTVFFKGCPARCWWCHNPESQLPDPEHTTRITRIDDREFTEEELTGRAMSVRDIMNEIEKDHVFMAQSGGGVTISGGEPLMQSDFLISLLQELRDRDFHTALDTTGYTDARTFRQVVPLVSLFLFDIKIMDAAEHLRYTGLDNAHILSNFDLLIRKKHPVIARFPVIPGITDRRSNLTAMISFLKTRAHGIERLDLLPYHNTAGSKYKRICRQNKMEDVSPPEDCRMNSLRDLFRRETGLSVHIGG